MQEVPISSDLSTGRRKDQRWWLQGKWKRKVFSLCFLSWPKDWMDARRHEAAMLWVVSGREITWEASGPPVD